MRFGLDADRDALRSAARDLLARLCPPSVVRDAWTQAPDDAPWQALADAGALGALAAEPEGGLGLDETYLVGVVEEAGRAALPHPLTATALVAAPLGVTGRTVATDLGSSGIVPSATYAEAFILHRDGELRLFDSHEADIEPVRTVDASRHCARVKPTAAGELLTSRAAAVAAAFDRGVLGTAAELVGLSRTMLELAVAHASQRHQFGKPIGSFQAVKHHLADARVQIEFAAPAVLDAAHALAHRHDDAGRRVSQAKWLAGAAASTTGRVALQCHGAIGYTTEHDLHLYLKRSWALRRSWGDAGFHADRVAASVGL